MYLYFWSILQNVAEVGLVLSTENSKPIRGKKKQTELWWSKRMPQTNTNVNWEIQPASILCKLKLSFQIFCTKVCLDGYSNMLELVQWGFIFWGTHEYLSPFFFVKFILLMVNDSGQYEAFQRENVVVHYFTLNVISWKQSCDLGVTAAVKKIYKLLL